MKKNAIFSLFLLFSFYTAFSQSSLNANITKVVQNKKAKVGVAIYHLEKKTWLSQLGNEHLPMQSVFKFHIAMAVLHQVDEGKLQLEQLIYIKKSDLSPDLYSPLRDKYPNGEISIPLSEILSYTVSQSDNSGCDILLKLIGGTKVVQEYISNQLDIKDISIKHNEEEMQKTWEAQYENWTTPIAACQLLDKFYSQKYLSKSSHNFLWKIMLETETGKKRLKGLLPKNIAVAHKTGSSGKNQQGMYAATNDMGIITLPKGQHFAICVFVSDSYETPETNEKIIAQIAKTAFDYYSTH